LGLCRSAFNVQKPSFTAVFAARFCKAAKGRKPSTNERDHSGWVPALKAAAVCGLDPASEEGGGRTRPAARPFPWEKGPGHAPVHAAGTASPARSPPPRVSAALPLSLSTCLLFLCLAASVFSQVFADVPSPCACLHVRPRSPVSFSPSACLALNCPGGLMATRTSACVCVLLLGYARAPLPTSDFQRLPASRLASVHLPPLALFIGLNRTGTCSQAVRA